MIYYLGYYSCEQIAAEKRVAAPPAMNKMGYVISAILEIATEKTVVVSPCETRLNRYVKGGLHKLNKNLFLKTFDSFQSKNKIIRALGHIWTKLQLYLYLMNNVKSDDTVIVYHSLALMKVVRRLKNIKKCNLIIEVEELYSDVKEDAALRKKELDYLQIADRYIIITEMLNKEVNLRNIPRIVSHGTYRTVPKYSEKFNDGRVHVVYAGSFNPIKGGACSAIESAEFLNENFVLHILGKGSAADTESVKKKIEQVALKSQCEIIFDGYKTGRDFDSFIQSCHIGLSTQQPDGKYNASSFPSKILMYMTNSVSVVSIRIPAVFTSDVKDYIYYYDNPTPKDIANAIMQVPNDCTCDPSDRLNELHESFVSDLNSFLKVK